MYNTLDSKCGADIWMISSDEKKRHKACAPYSQTTEQRPQTTHLYICKQPAAGS